MNYQEKFKKLSADVDFMESLIDRTYDGEQLDEMYMELAAIQSKPADFDEAWCAWWEELRAQANESGNYEAYANEIYRGNAELTHLQDAYLELWLTLFPHRGF